jgi:hypothetical protein
MNDLALSEETAIAPSDIIMNGESFTENDWDLQAQAVITELHETNDPSNIEAFITNLNAIEKISSRVKAKTIYAWSQWYKAVNKLDDFPHWFTQKFGGEELTVQKHQAIGELLMSDEVPDSVKQMNTKELVSVARAKQSGYNLDEHWEEIAHAGSEGEVNAIVRKVKNKPERQGTLNLSLQPDGTITAWMGDSMVSLGWLNVADRDDEDTPAEKRKILEIGIARITNNSRMKVK